MKPVNFDLPVNRRNTSSIKWNKYPDTNVIPMWVADMEFAVEAKIIEAMNNRLEHPVIGYTSAPPELITSVVDYLSDKHSWSIDRDWLVWLPGVVPGVAAACTMAGNAGDEILVFTPIYHPLLQIPPMKDRDRVDVPLQYVDKRWTIDFNAFERAITKRSKMLLLCSPHNPTGTLFSDDELRRVVEICAANNILLVSDEIHCDLVLHKTKTHCPTGRVATDLQNHVLTLMSPSKTFNLAGSNCSFAVIPDATIRERFTKACLYTVPIVPTLSYVAAQAAYRHGWAWHEGLIDYLRGNLDTLRSAVNELPLLSMDDTEATYLGWINTSEMPVADPHEFFLKAGVGLSPGAQFGDANFQRLNFACTREQLNQAIEKISRAVKTLA
ncbi:hypothetical protein AB833_16810 [Chromatiales bacterium (ex Bugula neritina AB1)]|nr:hypothetical protein AB833_16810 [Chromatiales bacterium (ex Bugula neritina AB1)]